MSERKRIRRQVIDENAFANSLDGLMPEDISDVESTKPKFDLSGLIRKVILFTCVAVFVYSSALMIDQLTSKVRANSAYDDIRDIFYDDSGVALDGALVMSVPSSAISPITGNVYEAGSSMTVDDQYLIKSKLDTLKMINSDVYGWIKIEIGRAHV